MNNIRNTIPQSRDKVDQVLGNTLPPQHRHPGCIRFGSVDAAKPCALTPSGRPRSVGVPGPGGRPRAATVRGPPHPPPSDTADGSSRELRWGRGPGRHGRPGSRRTATSSRHRTGVASLGEAGLRRRKSHTSSRKRLGFVLLRVWKGTLLTERPRWASHGLCAAGPSCSAEMGQAASTPDSFPQMGR